MIQNCLAESLTKNYKAPSYPIYIALQNSIHSINNKKSMKDSKSEVSMVKIYFNEVGSMYRIRGIKICPYYFNKSH